MPLVAVPESYNYYLLQQKHMPQMHRSFTEAFEDYAVNFELSYHQFANRLLRKLNIEFDYSMGAFSGDKLVGFLFHTINTYDRKMMAYNGGTGIIPGHRGYGLTKKMYEILIPSIATSGAQAIVLEVLKTNKIAIKTYRQIGFEKIRIFESFRLINEVEMKETRDLSILKSVDLKAEYETFGNQSVSFGDTFDQLQYNLENERILEAWISNEPVGYIIFQPSLGRISQFAVQKQFRRKGIGTNLIREAQNESLKPLTVINVHKRDHETIKFLGATGFIHSLTQLEMQLPLT
ncbi:MAG: GNAT family N-acetyltransferase [Bacteroidetes bacterium]|nr:GNAT family N-acetyltransferase [Bacteroidota bacterium]